MTRVSRRVAASWVLPVDSPPVTNGAVLLGDDGCIVALGAAEQVPAPPGVPTTQVRGAILPGLVNVHTHLELTGFPQVTAPDFPTWIRTIIAEKAARAPADYLAAARQGIQDCWAVGITTVADTGDSGAVIQALAELGASGVAYHEVFGPEPGQADASLGAARQRISELAAFAGPRIKLGLSPHAPYSVSGRLYALVARFAEAEGLPMAVHLAESEDEWRLLGDGSGGFAESWRARGIPLPAPAGCTPVAWLDRHGVLGPRTLCIHVVRATDGDLNTLAERGVAIAHCPGSNRRHRHGVAPLREFLRRGLRVGVGTDSVASLAPLDLRAEAREARVIGGLDGAAALRLITSEAARALGLEREVGSLAPGKWGDLVALDLPETVDVTHLADTVLSLPPGAVALTMVAGREVYRRGAR
ncbi:MAG TPA: amidohydrolase family protein [Gemmatimonadales bacterium]|nr:amidohydrolase family protein [Gemmatimonadales bacterium]